MADLDTAKASPRIEDGKFLWYEGNTFAIELEINLTNKDGESIILGNNDTIIVNFYKNNISMHKIIFTNFFENKIFIHFDEETTKKFKEGKYQYTITYIGNDTTTIVAKNEMEVEKWQTTISKQTLLQL